MDGAEEELERRSKFLNSLIQKKKKNNNKGINDDEQEMIRVRASDMAIPLQNRAFRCARHHLHSSSNLDTKRLALALKKEFDTTYGPAWHCIVGTSFGSYVTHSVGGFLYFSIDKLYMEATGSGGPPHDGLFLVIPHLGLFELLAMSEVCVSLRDAVMRDVLPWMNITVQNPLNLRLSDEILLKFTSKANGRLTTLALINCVHITDNGLQRVIETNPFINKLYIPACTGLTPEGIIRAVSANENRFLERLRIHGIPNIKKEHLVALNSFLGMNSKTRQQQQPVVFDGNYEMDHNRVIDVESCSKCNEVRMVFNCTRKACKCKGCEFCIPRCVECGGCIKSQDMEEAVSACAHNLCLDCWFKLPKCSFCNKPYCRLHANQWCTGHICYVCHERFIHNLPSHA